MAGQYEFTGDQNALIDTLATKMRGVGTFLLLLGLGMLVLAALGFSPTITDAPPPLPDGTPPEVLNAIDRYTAFVSERRSQVYYGALASAIQAIILLISGVYVRRSAQAFRQIVKTEGRDISHLLEALGALKGLFSLLATLLSLGLLIALGVIGLRIYGQLNGF
jgi:hypothetical protein